MKKYYEKYIKKEPLTIVCIGDSTTSQEWCHPNWYDWLNFKFRQDDVSGGEHIQILNMGIDGGDIDHYTTQFERYISRFKPDLVIMSLGFNEIETPNNHYERASKLLSMIKDINAEVLIWSTYETPNPKYSELLSHSNDTYRDLSTKYNATFIDMYNEFRKYRLNKLFTFTHQWVNELWELKPGDQDFLHCNEVGNQIIAQKILKEGFNTDLTFSEDFHTIHNGLGSMRLVDTEEYLV